MVIKKTKGGKYLNSPPVEEVLFECPGSFKSFVKGYTTQTFTPVFEFCQWDDHKMTIEFAWGTYTYEEIT